MSMLIMQSVVNHVAIMSGQTFFTYTVHLTLLGSQIKGLQWSQYLAQTREKECIATSENMGTL